MLMRKATLPAPPVKTRKQLEIERAFEEGTLYILTDEPQPRGTIQVPFVGSARIPFIGVGGKPVMVRHVHVMSKPAGGEIRGFILTGDGNLRLRLPCYMVSWGGMSSELEEAVMMRVVGAVAIAPYSIDGDSARPGPDNEHR